MATESISVRCCVAGGGPAGMMLGMLLARAGVDVLVLEKHADFLRDFRGDTIHPSTLEVMHELGLLPDLLRLPHAEARQISAHIGDLNLPVADFTHLPTRCRFLVIMPQWSLHPLAACRRQELSVHRRCDRANLRVLAGHPAHPGHPCRQCGARSLCQWHSDDRPGHHSRGGQGSRSARYPTVTPSARHQEAQGRQQHVITKEGWRWPINRHPTQNLSFCRFCAAPKNLPQPFSHQLSQRTY